VGLSLAGCGAGPQQIDTAHYEKATNVALQARTIYNSVQGDYSKLDPSKKEELLKLYDNKEDKAKKAWDLMAHPMFGGPALGPKGGSPATSG
jgi:hypothetical protein